MSATLFLPRSVDEAVSLLSEHGADLIVMGGGTVVMGMVNDGLMFPQVAMSLGRAGMDGVRRVNKHLEIGATTTLAQLMTLSSHPLLAQAAHGIGGPAVRNMGTIGGNLFLPQPYGDLLPALLAYDAKVVLAGKSGHRTIDVEALTGGTRTFEELLVGVNVPAAQGSGVYMRYGRRQANTPAITTVAARVVTESNGVVSAARIALGASAPTAIRARQAEGLLVGQPLTAEKIAAAAQVAANECDPFTDALATAWYRRKMVGVFVKRALEQLVVSH